MSFKQSLHRILAIVDYPFEVASSGFMRPASAEQPSGTALTRDYEDLRKVNSALFPLLALGFAAAIWVGWNANSVGSVLLWCMSCLSVGAAVGFLFGIPRAESEAAKAAATKYASGVGSSEAASSKQTTGDRDVVVGRPNTNLEEVSDWLTKIIVGLSLVHLTTIERRVMSICRNAAAAINLKPTDADVSAASALVVGFAVVGFLSGYLYTRLFLQGAFSRSDGGMRFANLVENEFKRIPPAQLPASGQPSLPSALDRESAERVMKQASADRTPSVLATLRTLAEEYGQLRQIMPTYSPERTRKMSEIVSKMRVLALAAEPYLSLLAVSNAPGDRLAAVVILQLNFDPALIEWLADRIPLERAFIGYQAASALLARVRVAGPPEKVRIKAAVEAARAKVIEPETERDKIVAQIVSEASN